MRRRHRLTLPPLLAGLALLAGAAPALAGGVVSVDGTTLRYVGDTVEPINVTIDRSGDVLLIDENGSRITGGPGCTVTADGYHAACDARGVERISVVAGPGGSDVRIRANLPAELRGGPGDDVLIGGPADDVIDGGPGQDVIGGGGGSDELRGGPDRDLVTYVDQIARNGTLTPRRGAVRIAVDRPDYSGAPGERDTIARDVEQVEGGAGNDRVEARDGLRTSIACGAGRDVVIADPRDDTDFDCDTVTVAPPPGGDRMTVPLLAYPFPRTTDSGMSQVRVEPVLPLIRGAVVVHVLCQPGVGLGALAQEAPDCVGAVRFSRGSTVMGTQRVRIRRGKIKTLRLPLTASRSLARRPQGLEVIATALPDRGDVKRVMRFKVRG